MSFSLQEWEIWHTYTTYLNCGQIDLDLAADSLVRVGMAHVVLKDNGRTYWKTTTGVGYGTTTLTKTPNKEFKLTPDGGVIELPKGFALEAWGQGSLFLHAESDVLGDESGLAERYLRAFLGKCVASNENEDGDKTSSLNLYPTLIIYESGVMTLELRMIGPSTPVALADFIRGGVNLFQERFDKVEVSPSIARICTAAYHQSQSIPFLKRRRLARLQVGHDLAVEQRTTVHEDEAFSFPLSPWSGGPNSLRDIALTLFHTAAFVARHPRRGLAFILLGQKKPPNLGAFWSGRPHVHVIRFDGQMQTATENEALYRPSFDAILARTPLLVWKKNIAFPSDSRMFEDYGAYVGSAVSLWVWSKKGIAEQEDRKDLNRGNFIYERQLLMEVLEHGYMLHRALYHTAEQIRSTGEAIAVQKRLLRFRLGMREASHAGEIRDLLEKGWKQLGLPALADDIARILSLKEAELRSADNDRATRVGWAIALVFGLVAVPSLADQLILPAWTKLQFHVIADVPKAKLIADGIAFFVVSLFLSISLVFTSNARSHR
jgi:hypothetical protein